MNDALEHVTRGSTRMLETGSVLKVEVQIGSDKKWRNTQDVMLGRAYLEVRSDEQPEFWESKSSVIWGSPVDVPRYLGRYCATWVGTTTRAGRGQRLRGAGTVAVPRYLPTVDVIPEAAKWRLVSAFKQLNSTLLYSIHQLKEAQEA
ncbi:hypothetical protein CHU98_g4097 [Xylaria longipes]|nr:hypothetical protein CHU98_g4097 [Xylaria longipes]